MRPVFYTVHIKFFLSIMAWMFGHDLIASRQYNQMTSQADNPATAVQLKTVAILMLSMLATIYVSSKQRLQRQIATPAHGCTDVHHETGNRRQLKLFLPLYTNNAFLLSASEVLGHHQAQSKYFDLESPETFTDERDLLERGIISLLYSDCFVARDRKPIRLTIAKYGKPYYPN